MHACMRYVICLAFKKGRRAALSILLSSPLYPLPLPVCLPVRPPASLKINNKIQAPSISECVGKNPEWATHAMPWAGHQKKACPTAYTFPYDDQTSTFTCFDGAGPGTDNYVNTQSCEFRSSSYSTTRSSVCICFLGPLVVCFPSSVRSGLASLVAIPPPSPSLSLSVVVSCLGVFVAPSLVDAQPKVAASFFASPRDRRGLRLIRITFTSTL